MGELQKDRIIAALGEVWASIADLVGGLSAEQWAMASPLPGWSVHDNVSHILGTESMLLGEPNPAVTIDREALSHIQNDIAEFNEVWVEHLRSSTPAEMVELFRTRTAARLDALEAMSQEEWDADSFTPAGPGTYGRFMQVRVFDCWLHEQDIRDTVGVPGHESGIAVDVTLDELELAMGYVVGKKGKAPDGSSVRFDLTDGGSVVRSIGVVIDGRAQLAAEPLDDPTTTLTMPVGVLTRRCAGRVEPDDERSTVEITGDVALGEQIFSALPYTI